MNGSLEIIRNLYGVLAAKLPIGIKNEKDKKEDI